MVFCLAYSIKAVKHSKTRRSVLWMNPSESAAPLLIVQVSEVTADPHNITDSLLPPRGHWTNTHCASLFTYGNEVCFVLLLTQNSLSVSSLHKHFTVDCVNLLLTRELYEGGDTLNPWSFDQPHSGLVDWFEAFGNYIWGQTMLKRYQYH